VSGRRVGLQHTVFVGLSGVILAVLLAPLVLVALD
jgi:hypothetical protein